MVLTNASVVGTEMQGYGAYSFLLKNVFNIDFVQIESDLPFQK